MCEYDETDAGIVAERATRRDLLRGPRIGDFVRFPTGEVERFSHDWGKVIQTSRGGSFYLAGAYASFSGGLNPAILKSSLTDTGEVKDGSFWIFHHGYVGAHRGVDFQIPCRVYETTETYYGFSPVNGL